MAEKEKKVRGRKKLESVALTEAQKAEAEQIVADGLRDNPEVFNLPDSKYTAESLADFFTKAHEGSKRILPKERRRYVMYLRRSTDDERKQVRSIDD